MVKSVRASFGLLKRLCALYVWYIFCAKVSCVDFGNMLQEKGGNIRCILVPVLDFLKFFELLR